MQSYIDPTKYPSELGDSIESKDQALNILRQLNENLLKELMNNEELIQTLRTDHPEAEKQETPSASAF